MLFSGLLSFDLVLGWADIQNKQQYDEETELRNEKKNNDDVDDYVNVVNERADLSNRK